MTPDEARAVLSKRRVARDPDRDRAKRTAAAKGRAASKARVALARMHPDDYKALCAVAIEQELAK